MSRPQQKPTPLLQSVIELKGELQGLIEMQRLIAEVRWHSYHDHIKVGFTPEQALELCKKITL